MGGSAGGTQTVVNQSSPEAAEAFRFRQEQAKAATANLGEQGAGYFTDPSKSPYKLSPAQQSALSGFAAAAANTPGMPTDNWAFQSWQPAAQQYWNTAQGGVPMDQWTGWGTNLMNYLNNNNPVTANGWLDYAQQAGDLAGKPIGLDMSGMGGGGGAGSFGVNYTATPATYSPVDVGTMTPVKTADIDPTAAIASAQNTLRTISRPSIESSLQASGLGRSGAEAEALAQEGVRLELPIQQQILQHQSQAKLLDAQIAEKQQETMLLEQQKAKLQAQALTATSYDVAQKINGDLAGIEAQLQEKYAEAQLASATQRAIQQRVSALQYASSTLGQMMSGNTAQNQLMGQVGLGLENQLMSGNIAGYQGAVSAGSDLTKQLGSFATTIPQLEHNWYNDQLLANQTLLGLASVPQQMEQADYNSKMQYLLSLYGATPTGQTGSSSTTASNPGALQYLGTGALLGSYFMPQNNTAQG